MDRPRKAHELAHLLDEIRQREATLAASPRVLALADGTGENDRVLIRGNPRKAGEEVSRRFLEVFHGEECELRGSRQRTSRVGPIVDGLSRSARRAGDRQSAMASSFRPRDRRLDGRLRQDGRAPDASRAARLPGSRADSQRLVDQATAAAVGHVSRVSPVEPRRAIRGRKSADPENRLVHKARVTRLEGEAIRDSILAVSGRLDERLEGPSVPVHLDDFMTGRGRPPVSGPLDGGAGAAAFIWRSAATF